MDIRSINPTGINPLLQQKPGVQAPVEGDFKNTMNSFLSDVNELNLDVDKKIEQFAAGEIKDVHQVMVAVEEASIAFKLMMEVRNKLMKAYQEVMRMQV